MDADIVINISNEAMKIALLLSAPLLISSLVVGVSVAIFQAVTQINEVTLTFIPKIVVMVLAFVLTAPWMLRLLVTYTTNLYEQIPMYIK